MHIRVCGTGTFHVVSVCVCVSAQKCSNNKKTTRTTTTRAATTRTTTHKTGHNSLCVSISISVQCRCARACVVYGGAGGGVVMVCETQTQIDTCVSQCVYSSPVCRGAQNLLLLYREKSKNEHPMNELTFLCGSKPRRHCLDCHEIGGHFEHLEHMICVMRLQRSFQVQDVVFSTCNPRLCFTTSGARSPCHPNLWWCGVVWWTKHGTIRVTILIQICIQTWRCRCGRTGTFTIQCAQIQMQTNAVKLPT